MRCAGISTRDGPACSRATRRSRRPADVGYDVVLFLHLLSLFALVGAITVAGVCYFRIRSAESLREAAQWGRLADQTGWVFPVAILGLLASGAYLTTDRWDW